MYTPSVLDQPTDNPGTHLPQAQFGAEIAGVGSAQCKQFSEVECHLRRRARKIQVRAVKKAKFDE